VISFLFSGPIYLYLVPSYNMIFYHLLLTEYYSTSLPTNDQPFMDSTYSLSSSGVEVHHCLLSSFTHKYLFGSLQAASQYFTISQRFPSTLFHSVTRNHSTTSINYCLSTLLDFLLPLFAMDQLCEMLRHCLDGNSSERSCPIEIQPP
jgi:hypothetical protein